MWPLLSLHEHEEPTCRCQAVSQFTYVNEGFRERLQSEYEQPDAQAIYQLRKQKAALPFGHIKRNLGADPSGGRTDHFLLRGLAGVRAEASLLATCFNIARLITLIGVPALIQKLAH